MDLCNVYTYMRVCAHRCLHCRFRSLTRACFFGNKFNVLLDVSNKQNKTS